MKQIIALAFSLIVGFVGGLVGGRLGSTSFGERTVGTIRARNFELVDNTGKVISIWGMNKNGDIMLAFLGSELVPGERQEHAAGLDDPLKLRTAVGVQGVFPFLTYRDSGGATRMDLALGSAGKPVLVMADEIGRSRVRLGDFWRDRPIKEDEEWALSFDPGRIWLGVSSQPEGAEKWLSSVFVVNKDKVKLR